jgi:hypothetical protein
MGSITREQVEPLFRQLPHEEQTALLAQLIRECAPDDELLEDLEDILFLQRHRHDDDELLTVEQVEENLRAKGLL